ncbi:hypothetical protein H2200_005661 [Cladophialophora chaetospira]|uniref:Uncharacterized protein n=1 Tax=Cladophialophora chaetospira TaxID=386627 RepID=A0AA38X9H1_9EURO|nr:hypothetical protein H2200_005661 [Cladophialophora chaetospira]
MDVTDKSRRTPPRVPSAFEPRADPISQYRPPPPPKPSSAVRSQVLSGKVVASSAAKLAKFGKYRVQLSKLAKFGKYRVQLSKLAGMANIECLQLLKLACLWQISSITDKPSANLQQTHQQRTLWSPSSSPAISLQVSVSGGSLEWDGAGHLEDRKEKWLVIVSGGSLEWDGAGHLDDRKPCNAAVYTASHCWIHCTLPNARSLVGHGAARRRVDGGGMISSQERIDHSTVWPMHRQSHSIIVILPAAIAHEQTSSAGVLVTAGGPVVCLVLLRRPSHDRQHFPSPFLKMITQNPSGIVGDVRFAMKTKRMAVDDELLKLAKVVANIEFLHQLSKLASVWQISTVIISRRSWPRLANIESRNQPSRFAEE